MFIEVHADGKATLLNVEKISFITDDGNKAHMMYDGLRLCFDDYGEIKRQLMKKELAEEARLNDLEKEIIGYINSYISIAKEQKTEVKSAEGFARYTGLIDTAENIGANIARMFRNAKEN